MNIGLLYPNSPKLLLIGYVDANYLSCPRKTISQTSYLFTSGDTSPKRYVNIPQDQHHQIMHNF
jgi:hypothetical protein